MRVDYLLNSIRPPLFDAVLCPHVVCILRQLVYQQFLTWSQFYVRQVQWRWLISVGHHVATDREKNRCPQILSDHIYCPVNTSYTLGLYAVIYYFI